MLAGMLFSIFHIFILLLHSLGTNPLPSTSYVTCTGGTATGATAWNSATSKCQNPLQTV
jgi:hypothetical protein